MDLKSNSTNHKMAIDSEKSTIEKFSIELKMRIYGVLFQMLRDDDNSIWWSGLCTLIQFVQVL